MTPGNIRTNNISVIYIRLLTITTTTTTTTASRAGGGQGWCASDREKKLSNAYKFIQSFYSCGNGRI